MYCRSRRVQPGLMRHNLGDRVRIHQCSGWRGGPSVPVRALFWRGRAGLLSFDVCSELLARDQWVGRWMLYGGFDAIVARFSWKTTALSHTALMSKPNRLFHAIALCRLPSVAIMILSRAGLVVTTRELVLAAALVRGSGSCHIWRQA